MPTARKRALQETASAGPESSEPPSMLHRIRNMWQFANLFQFILLFGKALKLDDDLDIEDLEAECLKPGSMALQEIGLGLLKFLSSHRGLTHELFDEYTRRQFLAKAPEKNPFGTEEAPAKFADFDVFMKIRVLQQMTQIVMMNPERLREKTDEQKDMDQTNWRIEPYGWDSHDRTYFVLDDNRIYRLTDAPQPPTKPVAKPKKNTKKAKAAQRASKRRRVSTTAFSEAEDAGDEDSELGAPDEPEDDGLGGMKWECIAVTLDEVRQFLSTIQKSRDDNEKVLRNQIQLHLVPILERQEESRKRKQLQREKELLNLEKLAHAKRSSRIAGKLEQQKAQEQAREEVRRRQEEEMKKIKEEAKKTKMEQERDKRLMSREQRLKEREIRRIQHEEELAQLSEDSKSTGVGRMSERHRQAEIEKNKRALQELEEEEDDWIFDCVCGFYGQVDDGTHSVACERCNVWQHSKCLGIAEEEADQNDFHFICDPCKKREQELREQRPRIIKLKLNRPGSSQSSTPQKANDDSPSAQRASEPQLPEAVSYPSNPQSSPPRVASSSSHVPSVACTAPQDILPARSVSNHVDQVNPASPAERPSTKPSPGRPQNNPFSSPHPTLTPPVSFDDSRPHARGVDMGEDGNRHLNGAIFGQSGSGNGPLPSKQPPRLPSPPATKMSLAGSTETRELGSAVPAVPPHFTPAHSQSQAKQNGSPLLPLHGGLSPTKHSPPQRQANGIVQSTMSPLAAASHAPAPLFPPAAALSPVPQQQILTPPVKSSEPPRSSPLEKV
ncbi:reticulocyte-binding protein 2 a [Echria macrotheca]|uniref:Reticulocyte-binding protein 2 a n=1 Tax=Echria macrotheca TaxID=438768 RepID=A0AAJ0BG32_9PEZI|nr:reticulocyte-binding protein 2 a [Echria macrotheca]